jgi:hypothetical protein
VSKFGAFLSNEMMRNVIGQTKSAFDLRTVMDNKKILLVNLSKGRTGDLNSKLLGMIFVMKFQAAAMSRSDVLEDERVDFSLYVDEFQNFSTDSFATIMSEARKFHLNLIVANQFTTQLTQEIRDAVFGNMGTIVSFRIGQNDVESLGKYFHPTFDSDDLLRVPNYNTIVRTLIGGIPTQPFSMSTLPPLGTPRPRLAIALKQLSSAKYGRPRSIVEAEIVKRMATRGGLPAGGATSAPRSNARLAGGPTAQPKPAASGSSFLDDWLSKRQGYQAPAPAVAPSALKPKTSLPPAQTPAKSPAKTSKPTQSLLPDTNPNPPAGVASQPLPTPQAPPLSAASVPTPTPKNISSNELVQNEVDGIAAELKQKLNTPNAPLKHGSEVHPNEGDTIFIDHDGAFHLAEDLKKADNQAAGNA